MVKQLKYPDQVANICKQCSVSCSWHKKSSVLGDCYIYRECHFILQTKETLNRSDFVTNIYMQRYKNRFLYIQIITQTCCPYSIVKRVEYALEDREWTPGKDRTLFFNTASRPTMGYIEPRIQALRGFSPQVNYIDRATTACRRS
jgi:hypothetical protein